MNGIDSGLADQEIYREHLIVVRLRRLIASGRWAAELDIRCPDGGWLPTIIDEDRSYPDESIAMATGNHFAREIIDARLSA